MALPASGTTDIPTAGTRVRINNTPRRVFSLLLKARNGNTGSIYVGDSGVSSTNGFELRANEAYSVNYAAARQTARMDDFWADTATNGNDVDWFAMLAP